MSEHVISPQGQGTLSVVSKHGSKIYHLSSDGLRAHQIPKKAVCALHAAAYPTEVSASGSRTCGSRGAA